MQPFHLTFTLSRRQRLGVELMPWLPAAAATVGFGVGAVYLANTVSVWFLLLLAGPLLAYPGLFRFAYEIAFCVGPPVELHVDDSMLEVTAFGERRKLALGGIFQVYKSEGVWTVLHLERAVLTIPVEAISDEQIGYLKSFARRAAAERA
ncbi:hypothetical protein R5W24_005292 [Gemmata sp. JC717]|uniref:hypothetical protein n=1 Tax=Gemmata algarum TaxID=2975278 RepID=UPI0021BBA129|nr:hypothetical protein [Gemmata algarum]MDY3556129.1 hypothetical protein [Gemmata algarum]